MDIDEAIYSKSAIMDSSELQALSSRLGIKYNMIDLKNLASNPHFYSFVHTGEHENEFNSGLTNHWLAVYGPYIFDSYGKYAAWKLPPGYRVVQTIPRALQEYNTNVCGMYAAAYLAFCVEENSDGTDDLGREFCIAYGFGKNREINDTIILSWYDFTTGKNTQ